MSPITITDQPKKSIAIFDDDEDILSICSYILTEQGWSVHTFNNCNHILDKLAPVHPTVIFMDNWIPDKGGVVATQILKNSPRFQNIPVIYFSANADIELLAQNAGADAYLAKPFNLEELAEVIDRVQAAVK
ncbi:response regulator [Mucilaginibacter boryungensis]|uniref:Response regulator n=1 Tax=Mucilaginibacter boryungensis TaxID=768480 RepID=A0ABR9XH57_9SPHI|nr:response regulator [Mucilaginibacter boryungensis]MBE9666566.1 response regulator [Mucilaginibacter boryungensis]